jgi:hypothetical protein
VLFNILATFAEFEVDLLRMRTREGMAIARAKGRLKGKRPSSAPPNGPFCSSSTLPATTRSPSLPNCSQSAAPGCTANWLERTTNRDRTALPDTCGERWTSATQPPFQRQVEVVGGVETLVAPRKRVDELLAAGRLGYVCSRKGAQAEPVFIEGSGKAFNTVPPNDFSYCRGIALGVMAGLAAGGAVLLDPRLGGSGIAMQSFGAKCAKPDVTGGSGFRK